MSENINVSMPPHPANVPPRPHPERGAINLEMLDSATLSLRIGYHGLRQAVAERRARNNQKLQERMEHKDALYTGLGELAMNNGFNGAPQPTADIPTPQTWAERRVDRRMNRSPEKRAVKFFMSRGKTTASEVKTIRDINARRVQMIHKNAPAAALTQSERRKQKRQVRKDVRSGHKTRQQGFQAKLNINAQPVNLAVESQRYATRKKQNVDDKLAARSEQPILSKWRELRRNEAVATKNRSTARAQRHSNTKERLMHEKRLKQRARNLRRVQRLAYGRRRVAA